MIRGFVIERVECYTPITCCTSRLYNTLILHNIYNHNHNYIAVVTPAIQGLNKINTECVPMDYGGTKYPGWMDGGHPDVGETVDRTVSVQLVSRDM